MLQTVEYEFHAARDAELLEDPEQIIAHDLLLARGWTARKVAIACYTLTAGLVVAGWATMRMDFSRALFTSVLIGGGLLAAGVRLGSLRSHEMDMKRAAAGNPQSRWRWQAVRRARQKI